MDLPKTLEMTLMVWPLFLQVMIAAFVLDVILNLDVERFILVFEINLVDGCSSYLMD